MFPESFVIRIEGIEFFKILSGFLAVSKVFGTESPFVEHGLKQLRRAAFLTADQRDEDLPCRFRQPLQAQGAGLVEQQCRVRG